MLKRVIAIRNVGRLHRCHAVGDVEMRRFTVVHAENGRGKTTLCAVLRSLAEDRADIVIGRQTLGEAAAPDIQLLLSSGTVRFHDGHWSERHPEFLIFDQTFISDNVFAGDIVDTNNRRNMYNIIIGREGVQLARRMAEIDEEVRTKNAEIRANRALIQERIPATLNVDDFITLELDESVDAKIAAKNKEVVIASRASNVRTGRELELLEIPIFPADFAQVLSAQIDAGYGDAEKIVATHLVLHKMGSQGEEWIERGLHFIENDECGFCGQAIDGVQVVDAYRTYFGDDYRKLKRDALTLDGTVQSAFSERAADEVCHALLRNGDAANFWSEYFASDQKPTLDSELVRKVYKEIRDTAGALLKAKADAPLSAPSPGSELSKSLKELDNLRSLAATYNERVAAFNGQIAATKADAEIADLVMIQRDFDRLSASKFRREADAVGLCDTDARLSAEKRALEEEKASAKDRLDAHTVALVQRYGQSINRYLARLNAGFTITQPAHSYRGGVPNSSYQIVINDTTVQLGDAATPLDRASFKNTLSSGDKGSLALAFFFASLECEQRVENRVVIFDDPFTSLDNFRRHQTVSHIVRAAEVSAQVIVLSHEPHFLKQVWDRARMLERKALQMERAGQRNTNITEWDIDAATQDSFMADLMALRTYFDDAIGEKKDVVKRIRPALEAYFKRSYSMYFQNGDTLGGMVEKIRGGGPEHSLSHLLNDIDDINDFSCRHHHADGTVSDSAQIDDSELQQYIGMTLDIIGGGSVAF